VADSRFYTRAAPMTLARIAGIADGKPAPGADETLRISDVAPLETAGPGDLSFYENRRFAEAFAATTASACLVKPEDAHLAPQGVALVFCSRPYRAFALVARAFYPEPPSSGQRATGAVIDPDASVDASADIGPCAVIGAGAEIGPGCRIEAHAVVGPGVVLGEGTVVGVGASLSHCVIGARVRLYPGVRIGQDGFGYASGPEGHLKIPQLGRVLIEDDVEIGANTTIDRGSGPDTIIRRGSIIDNQVQIGHNVEVGEGCVIVAQSGVAGSSKLGDQVVLAAQSGISGHLRIGAGAKIAAQSGVMRDVKRGEEVCGAPAIPIRQFWRQQVKLSKLTEGKG
jgi:UDP-3-O-[3-hydroxymyristoyl] glucosamine N-acyltransferase